jgi:hypothetical protein
VFKGGFGALRIAAVASDGNSVAFYSPGVFSGAPSGAEDLLDYLARRTTSGWSTAPLMPPAPLTTRLYSEDLSPSLDTELAMGAPGLSSEDPLPGQDLLVYPTVLPDAVASWELTGVVEKAGKELLAINEEDANVDFCHILLKEPNGGSLVTATKETAKDQLYEFDRGCGGEGAALKLVAVNNKGKIINQACTVDVGVEQHNGRDTFNAVSRDGSEVFFTDCMGASGGANQLFVRLEGSRTVEVSKPFTESCHEVPCKGASERGSAEFAGASEDGSRVFFTAPLAAGQAPLVAGDADASNNLYMATVGCPPGRPECVAAEREVTSLTQASHAPSGAAEVQGVVRVAPDGERAYFVARGELLSTAQLQAVEAEGRPMPRAGADNLYVYDASTGAVAFVGALCSGDELSGAMEDIRCPSQTGSDAPLWSKNLSEAQTAGQDGRFLVFATYAQLDGSDTNAAKDVYRYDSETGTLERVSTGEGGYDANGNGGLLGAKILAGHHGQGDGIGPLASQYELKSRAVSEDGSRIVFSSAEPLSPAASNGLANAYEWHEGSGVSLVSSGSGEEPVEDVVVSPDGLNVFFDTVEGLVAQDIDGAPDVYDARLEEVGEGFGQSVATRRPCEGDACQGPLSNPAPLLVPGSVAQAPGANFAPDSKPLVKTKRKTVKKKAVARRRGGKKRRVSARPVKATRGKGRGGR